MTVILLLLGLIGLWLGSEQVVKASKALAKRFGMSELLIGITIVSIGTSLPEIMVTVFSGASGNSDIAIGAMIGSCLAQVTIILGIAAIVHEVKAEKKAMYVDAPMMLVGILVFGVLLFTDGQLTRFEGALMIVIYFAYIWYTSHVDVIKKNKIELGCHKSKGYPAMTRIGQFLLGMVILLGSAHLVLTNAIAIAQSYGLSESFIGVMIIGTASGLPELSTAIVGMYKKSPSIAVGTLIGSNITDPLLSTGLGALINGFKTNYDLLAFDLPFWFMSSVLALVMLFWKGETLFRYQAAILIGVYVGFIVLKLGIVQTPEWMILF